MEMERVEASLRGWPQAPFKQKIETDANYHRMLAFGMQPENLAAVRLGDRVAQSVLAGLRPGARRAAKALDRVQFEMLEGMANHQRRALFELSRNVLLYAPACRQEDFINAIGYLVRRLDENTGPDNFLRHAFALTVDSADWQQARERDLSKRLRGSSHCRRCAATNAGSGSASRGSSGAVEHLTRRLRPPTSRHSSPTNPTPTGRCRRTASGPRRFIDRWQPQHGDRAADVPLVIAGEEITVGSRTARIASIPRGPASSSPAIIRRTTPTSNAPSPAAAKMPAAGEDLSPANGTKFCTASPTKSPRDAAI